MSEERILCIELNLEGADVSKSEKKNQNGWWEELGGGEIRMRSGEVRTSSAPRSRPGEDIIFPHHKQYEIFEEY